MDVDKNLFMYDLAAVTIVYNEAPYIAEWLDYHLLAGVDHFVIYDNDSADNLQKILAPYVDKNLVTVIPYPKTGRQLEAYNDAIRYFKYFCRRMVFLDVDEYIFPQHGKSISDVTDEIFNATGAAGFVINLHNFGSNNFENADYSVGVLDRFTRRAEDAWAPLEISKDIPSGNAAVKTVADPRRVKLFSDNPHVPEYFENCCAVNESGKKISTPFNFPVTADKIVINCYVTKSRAEYAEKIHRRNTMHFAAKNEIIGFDENDRNEISDDGILQYRENLRTDQIPEGGDFFKIFADKKKVANSKLFKALTESLMPDFSKRNLREYFALPKNRTTYFNELIKFYKKAPAAFFQGKAETFLTCLAVSAYFKRGYLDAQTGAMFEEASLNALCKTFMASITLLDARLVIAELPRLLAMPYAATGSLVAVCLEILPQFLDNFRKQGDMKNFEELSYILSILKIFAVRVR